MRMRETLFKAFLPLVLAAVLPFAVRAEKANVFFLRPRRKRESGGGTGVGVCDVQAILADGCAYEFLASLLRDRYPKRGWHNRFDAE